MNKKLFLISALIFVSFAYFAYADVSTTNLVAYYTFDDANTTGSVMVDSAGTQQNLTCANTGTGSAGILGETYSFDGTAKCQATDHNDLDLPGNFTVMAWVNTTSTAETWTYIVHKSNDGGDNEYANYNLRKMSTYTAQTFFGDTTTAFYLQSNTTTINDGAWHFLVATFNNNTGVQTFYVDGAALANATRTLGAGKQVSTTNKDLGIGVNIYNIDSNHWIGTIDEVGVWGRPLSAAEVSELYNSGSGLAYPFTGGADEINPSWSNNITNDTTPKISEAVQFNITWSDETAISHCVFGWDNGTGVFANDSAILLPTGGVCSINKTIQQSAGTTMQWRFHGNDTSDNWNVSTIESFVVADTSAVFSNNNTNDTTPKITEHVQFNITVTDADNISTIIFSYDNGTGTFFNSTNLTISNTSVIASVNKTIERSQGTTIQWKWYVNDSANNWGESTAESLDVANTPPTHGTPIINSSDTSNRTNGTLSCLNQSTSDADGDAVTNSYQWFKNGSVIVGVTTSTLESGNFSKSETIICEITPNDGTDDGTKKNASTFTVANTQVPTPTTINWKTTGGFTDSTLTLGEIFDWINATCTADQDSDLANCAITIKDPDSVLAINNATMTDQGSNIYSYATDYEPDKAGTWTINVTAWDGDSSASATSTFTIGTQNQSTKDGWYGYSESNLTTNATFDTLSAYGYDLVELTINDTRILTDWNTTLGIIDYANDKNMHIGLNMLITINQSNGTQIEAVKQNISNTYSILTTTPYSQTVEYLSLELSILYGDTNDTNVLNNISERITTNTSNDFAVYSKTINSTSLDDSYIDYTPMVYITAPNLLTWIELEKAWARNRTTLNRIYKTTNTTVWDSIQNYQEDILDNLRGTLTGVPHQTAEVAMLSNNDTIIFNNNSAYQSISIDVSDFDVSGEDVYDLYIGYVIESNTTGVLSVNVTGEFATLLFFDDLDHVELTSDTEGTIYKASTIGSAGYNYSHTPGVTPSLDNFGLSGAGDIMIDLFDPTYTKNNFITYYGWLNASFINMSTRGCDYSIVILADNNSQEINRLNFSCGTEYYGYISVADYGNNDTWQTAKESQIDMWLSMNESMNLFIDGLDTGVGGTNFSTRFKELSDYVRITKGRKAIYNTYTAYEDFCAWGDGCMKESCVNRWNGTLGVPEFYDRENWDLELNKSTWYDSHGVTIYCQAFDNRTSDTYQILDYTELENIYFASKVLGYDYFYLSQPDFNYAHLEYVYDVGDDLSNGWSTNDNETYYRRYENGVVYYNSSSEDGWIDDGRTINSINITMELYDNGYDGKTVEFNVNRRGSSAENGDYVMANSNDYSNYVWTNISKSINLSTAYTNDTGGRYTIEGWVMPRSTTPGQGWSIRNSLVPNKGTRNSWWDASATDTWNLYGMDKNWLVYLVMNSTTKTSIDDTTAIWQNSSTSSTQTKVNISSDKPFKLEIWSNEVETQFGYLYNASYYNSTGWIEINITNTTTCDSNSPSFNYSGINSTHLVGACYENVNGSSLTVRFSAPETSIQQFMLEGDSGAPTFSGNNTNDTSPKISEAVQFNITWSDDTDISGFIFSYDNGTGILVNDSFSAVNNRSIIASINKTIERTNGTTIQWKFYANDSAGQWNSSVTESLVVANTVPTTPSLIGPANNSNFTSIPVLLNYSSYDADNYTITYYVNINGSINGSTTGNWSFNGSDSTYLWYVIAGDGSANSSSSSTRQLTIDSTPPYFSNNITNDTLLYINQHIQFNITITDSLLNVAGFIFSWDNGTGTFVNDSFRTFDKQNGTVSVNKTVDRVKGTTLQWKWYANDTFGNWNESISENLTVSAPGGGTTTTGGGGGGDSTKTTACLLQGLVLGPDGLCISKEECFGLGLNPVDGVCKPITSMSDAVATVKERVGYYYGKFVNFLNEQSVVDYPNGICDKGENPFKQPEDCQFSDIMYFIQQRDFGALLGLGWLIRYTLALIGIIWIIKKYNQDEIL